MDLKDREALAKEFGQEFQEMWQSSAGRDAMAEKIVKYIRLDVEQRDLSGLVLDKDYFSLGQTPEYILREKLRAYWHAPGSYAPRTQMIQRAFTVPTDMISCHPEYEIGQLKAGRYGSISDQMQEARNEILGQINSLVFNTLVASIPTTNQNYAALTSSNVTKAALDNALNWVNDQPGGAKAIIGRRSKMDAITNFNSTVGTYSDKTLDDIMRDGVVNIYRGVPVIGLSQYYDGNHLPTIDPNEILVVGNKVGKFVVTEDIQQMADIDVDDLMWHMHVWTRVGCAVFHPQHMYRISLST